MVFCDEDADFHCMAIMRPGRHDLEVNRLRDLHPRHSLIAGIIWLVVALAVSFAVAASIWAGRVAREIVVQQHVRRLALETDQLAADVGQAITVRLDVLRAVGAALPVADLYAHLTAVSPNLGWIAVADATGTVLASDGSIATGTDESARPWFSKALTSPWIGVIVPAQVADKTSSFGDMAVPLKDADGRTIAVIAAHLNWQRAPAGVLRLSDALEPHGTAQSILLNGADVVVVGPAAWRDRVWNAAVLNEAPPILLPSPESGALRFERLPEGQTVLVARAVVAIDAPLPDAWRVQLSEPKESVYQRANALEIRIWWISLSLGTLTAVLGALGARRLTNRLKALARSATAVGRNESARIEVPGGHDEVAQLGNAFAKVLDDLREERRELLLLSSELERRVAVRTREVERLAEESRYAAIVRERLQIARDLHDTLAHSMMAMLSEVRLLRRLQARDPQALADELTRAEEVAHAGLNEARSAIAQMRSNTVRDTGLGPALAKSIERFKDHTGLEVEFSSDAKAASFGDERAQVLLRMSEEALRNIERHAHAAKVRISLHSADAEHLRLEIGDDGVGFDPEAARPGHFGLIGLREQAQLIGAQLSIASEPGRGTTLSILLRIAPEALSPLASGHSSAS
jgi:signal transduction histidine kinase